MRPIGAAVTVAAKLCEAERPPGSVAVMVASPAATAATVTALPATEAVATVVSEVAAAKLSGSPSDR